MGVKRRSLAEEGVASIIACEQPSRLTAAPAQDMVEKYQPPPFLVAMMVLEGSGRLCCIRSDNRVGYI